MKARVVQREDWPKRQNMYINNRIQMEERISNLQVSRWVSVSLGIREAFIKKCCGWVLRKMRHLEIQR